MSYEIIIQYLKRHGSLTAGQLKEILKKDGIEIRCLERKLGRWSAFWLQRQKVPDPSGINREVFEYRIAEGVA